MVSMYRVYKGVNVFSWMSVRISFQSSCYMLLSKKSIVEGQSVQCMFKSLVILCTASWWRPHQHHLSSSKSVRWVEWRKKNEQNQTGINSDSFSSLTHKNLCDSASSERCKPKAGFLVTRWTFDLQRLLLRKNTHANQPRHTDVMFLSNRHTHGSISLPTCYLHK